MLKEKLQKDIKDALKSGDSKKRMVLGMVLAAIKNKEIEKRSDLGEDDVIAVIASEIKKRKDSVGQYEKGGRSELAEGEKKEIVILMNYMPEQISEDEIRKLVRQTIAESASPVRSRARDGVASPEDRGAATSNGMKEMGKVIGSVMARIKGKADGQIVSRIVKDELTK